uniref:Uncharacterized protein n=1 Tax=Poecilia reticulata TaxID=8081 RepID=A0A3P9PKG4_POERE
RLQTNTLSESMAICSTSAMNKYMTDIVTGPVPFRWVMTIRFELPIRSTGWLSPGSKINGEKIKEGQLFIYLRSTIFTLFLSNHHIDIWLCFHHVVDFDRLH